MHLKLFWIKPLGSPTARHLHTLTSCGLEGVKELQISFGSTKGFLKHPWHLPSVSKHPRGAKGKKLAMSGQAGAWEVCNSRRSPMACPWLRRRLRTPQTGKEGRVGALRTKASFPAVWRNPVHRLRGSLRGRPGPGLPGLGGDYSCVRAPDSSLQAGNAPGTESRSQGWRKSERNESK